MLQQSHQPRGHGAASCGDDGFFDVVKPNELVLIVLFKMTRDRVADFHVQFVDGISFRKDGFAQGSGQVSAFWGFFYEKNDFVHGL